MNFRPGNWSLKTRWHRDCCHALALLLVSASLSADYAEPREDPETQAEALDFILHPFTPLQPIDEAPQEAEPVGLFEDECDWDLSSPHLQEDSQEVVRGATCHSFRWFDGLFGDEIDYPEESVNGLVRVGAEYTEYDGFKPRLRFRVRAPLPNMSSRWDLVLGRGDEEAFVSDTETQDETFYNPGLIDRDSDDEWLLGLGHRRGKARRGWDWSAGIRLGLPLNPYVKSQWYYNKNFSDSTDLRFRQTFFWRNDDGFGTTSRGDFSWSLNPQDVLRLEGVATVSESTDGARWYLGHTWYHLLGDNKAFSLLSFVRGETDAEVEMQEYGFNFIWRRPFTRDWMYLSYGPSITWPRYFEDESRDLSLGFGVWIEMEFGDWRY